VIRGDIDAPGRDQGRLKLRCGPDGIRDVHLAVPQLGDPGPGDGPVERAQDARPWNLVGGGGPPPPRGAPRRPRAGRPPLESRWRRDPSTATFAARPTR